MSSIISGLKWLATVIFLYTLFSFITLSAQQKYRIYLDADFSGARASSHAIKQGVTTALAEVDHMLQGFKFELVLKNHRANSLRSRRNLEDFLADEQALLVFSGLHSPPLLANKSFINKNRILLLDPWAAAGPITRSNTSQNWIFRLSIDDSKAGIFISQQALQQGFKKPYLLLEDTGWGRSNSKTMSQALKESAVKPIGLSWFNWGISKNVAKVLLREITASGADVIFFVGNSNEGVTFIQAMLELPKSIHLPVRSHWGITGGNFIHQVSPLQQIDLQFIQTKFSFVNEKLPILAKKVISLAIKSNHDIKSKKDIKASSGFIHAYDLTKIMIKAIEQVKLTGDKSKDSHLIHRALENLSAPVYGLLKKYNRPFKPYTKFEADAHEALSIDDYAMGQFDNNNNVILLD